MAQIAYVRVSTVEQNEARQVEALEKHGIDKWFTEKVSGKNMERPKLEAMLDYVREGDTVYIHDLSRLARYCSSISVSMPMHPIVGMFLQWKKIADPALYT